MSTDNTNAAPESAPNAVPDGTKAITRFTAEHGMEVGLPSPEAVNYMMSVAKLLADTALIGSDMGLTGNQIAAYKHAGWTIEQVEEANRKLVSANSLAKMLIGIEFHPRIPPMAAQQEIDIVKGKIFVRHTHLMAQMEAKKIVLKQISRTHERAAVEVSGIPGREGTETYEFTIEDAKRANLDNPNKPDYDQYRLRPRVMLWARLISEVYRATGGRGNVYTPEEKREILDTDRQDAAERGDGGSEIFSAHARQTAGERYPVGSTEAAAPAAPVVDVPFVEDKVETTVCISNNTFRPKTGAAPEPPASGFTGTIQGGVVTAFDAPNKQDSAPAAAAPAGDAPVSGSGQQDLKATYDRLIDLCPRISPVTAQNKFGIFLKAFLNKKKLVKGDVSIMPIRFLESLLKTYNENLLEDPEGMGLACGVGWREFQKSMDEWIWSDRCRELATDLIFFADHAKTGGKDTIEWLGKESLDVESLAEPDIYAFLRVANRTMLAGGLLDIAKVSGKRVHQVVDGWGIDVDKAPAGGIEALLKGAPVEAAKPAENKSTVAQDEEAGESVDDVLSLFD